MEERDILGSPLLKITDTVISAVAKPQVFKEGMDMKKTAGLHCTKDFDFLFIVALLIQSLSESTKDLIYFLRLILLPKQRVTIKSRPKNFNQILSENDRIFFYSIGKYKLSSDYEKIASRYRR